MVFASFSIIIGVKVTYAWFCHKKMSLNLSPLTFFVYFSNSDPTIGIFSILPFMAFINPKIAKITPA